MNTAAALESRLLAREIPETSAVGGRTSSTSSSSSTTTTATIAKPASATTTTTTISESTSTTAITKASTSSTSPASTGWGVTIVRTRLAEVEAQRSAFQVSSLHAIHGGFGLLDGGVGHVAETFGCTSLTIGRQSYSHNGAVVLERSRDLVLINVEADVADPESVGWFTRLITVRLSSRLKLVLLISTVAGNCKVNVDLAAIKISALFGSVSLGGIRSVGEFNIAKARRKVSVAILETDVR